MFCVSRCETVILSSILLSKASVISLSKQNNVTITALYWLVTRTDFKIKQSHELRAVWKINENQNVAYSKH